MATPKPTPLEAILETLGPRLSTKATVHPTPDAKAFSAAFTSWSDFNKQVPSAVIKIRTIGDALETVLWATSHAIPFAVKAGGHSNFCTVGKGGVVIDLSGLNDITVHDDSVTVQTGALTGDLVAAVYAQGRCVVTGACNNVGVSGSCLGGGLGPLQGLHGLISDNLLSARVITAAGELLDVSSQKHPELFWALRGAGMRFGLVVDLTLRTYPLATLGSDDGSVWEKMLLWGEEQIEDVAGRLNALDWKRGEAVVYYGFASLKEGETITPVCMAILNYFGPTPSAEAHFQPLLSLTPLHPLTPAQPDRIPYNHINDLQAPQQAPGGFKTQFGVGVQRLCPASMRQIWAKYTSFIRAHPGAFRSAVLAEMFSMSRVRAMGAADDTAFPHRHVNFWTFALAWYDDPRSEAAAAAFGGEVRHMLRGAEFCSAGRAAAAYVNFSRGDESMEETYGGEERVQRLQALKRVWDPETRFGGLVPRLHGGVGSE